MSVFGRNVLIALAGFLVLSGAALGQQPEPAPGSPEELPPELTGDYSHIRAEAPIEPLGEDRYRIGTLILDRVAREIRFPGAIALREGPLEYLACSPRGKLYESLLRGDVDPYHLHVALLMMGLVPENNLEFQGDATPPGGDPVVVEVAWQVGEERVVHRAEDLIGRHAREGTMERTPWVFSGSQLVDGIFAASMHRSLIAVYSDPDAILNNPLPTAADDTFYVPHTASLPPVGTEVEIILRAADAD
jgi:hypothetical protein